MLALPELRPFLRSISLAEVEDQNDFSLISEAVKATKLSDNRSVRETLKIPMSSGYSLRFVSGQSPEIFISGEPEKLSEIQYAFCPIIVTAVRKINFKERMCDRLVYVCGYELNQDAEAFAQGLAEMKNLLFERKYCRDRSIKDREVQSVFLFCNPDNIEKLYKTAHKLSVDFYEAVSQGRFSSSELVQLCDRLYSSLQP